jgi:hypothetical protein
MDSVGCKRRQKAFEVERNPLVGVNCPSCRLIDQHGHRCEAGVDTLCRDSGAVKGEWLWCFTAN